MAFLLEPWRTVATRTRQVYSRSASLRVRHSPISACPRFFSVASFEYDENGHTIRKIEQDGTVTLYEYDLAERLSLVRIENGPVLGSYRYDPFGRRISKTTQQGTIYFHYDDTGLLAEYDSNGNLLSEYQYWLNSTWMTNPLFKREGATNLLHYYYNGHLGQPLKLFSRNGELTWAAQRQAFGKLAIAHEGVRNNLRFPGQYFDRETDLYHNYRRDYSPDSGKYIQSDPIGINGGVNYYIYAHSNPIFFFDEDGRKAKKWDNAAGFGGTSNCQCMQNCYEESSPSWMCDLAKGKNALAHVAAVICEAAIMHMKCESECYDHCNCDPGCGPCPESPYP